MNVRFYVALPAAAPRRVTVLGGYCAQCGLEGHTLADCPEMMYAASEEGPWCTHCGSKEHTAEECNWRDDDDEEMAA